MLLYIILLAVAFAVHTNAAPPDYRCPSGITDGHEAVTLTTDTFIGGYTVKWVTNSKYFVDLLNIEAICYAQGEEPKGKTSILLQLSRSLTGTKNITVNTTENEVMECRISGCFIDSDWGDVNSIKTVIIKIGEIALSPSPSPSPSRLYSSLTTSGQGQLVKPTIAPCACKNVLKRSITDDDNEWNNQLTPQCNYGIFVIPVCILILLVCTLQAIAIALLVATLKKTKKLVS